MKEVFVLLMKLYPITELREEHESHIRIKFKGEEVYAGDNYHSIEELYEHRLALCVALWRLIDNYITPLGTRIKCWKSRLHSDGSMIGDDYFIVGMTIPQFEGPDHQISYHYKMEHWDKFNVIELPKAPEYDGHTPKDVIERLMKI